MTYEIKGGSFPIVECTLKSGESMITQSGSMCWMDSSITMETSSNGGIGKVVGRLFTREKLFQNIYTSTKDESKIIFGTAVPGSIMAVDLTGGQSIICQKSAFLASYGNIELSTYFNKKIGAGLFGGEGFIMQKLTGEGTVFLEIDGSSVELELQEGEKKIISTGYLVSMSESCTMDVETVKGVKNIFLGGEGIFNTTVTGPGKIILQTMPLPRLANSIIPFLPIPTNSTPSTGNSTIDGAASILKMINRH
jgi:uncharacterized protein (TIGR00266 family)